MKNRAYDPLREGKDEVEILDPEVLLSIEGFKMQKPGIISDGERFHAYYKSITLSARCYKCGCESRVVHCYYPRNPQMLPVKGKPMVAHLLAKIYECVNDNCNKKYFAEQVPGLRRYQQRMNDLNAMLLGSAILSSASGTSQVYCGLGADVSHDSIRTLLLHISLPETQDVEKIMVDDVAKRKGTSYYTIIYNMDTGAAIALINGRDGQGYLKWLQEHKKVNLVCRDRASAYSWANKKANPEMVEISDKFHLYQRQSKEYISKIIEQNLPPVVLIKEGRIVTETVHKVVVPITPLDDKRIASFSFDNSPPLDKNGKEIVFDDKSHNLNRKENIVQAEKNREKYNKVNNIREYFAKNPSADKTEACKLFQVSIPTLKTYLKMSQEEVERILIVGGSYQRKDKKMSQYSNIIYKMIAAGCSAPDIYSYILSNGYDGNLSSLATLITSIANNNFNICFGSDDYVKEVYPEGYIAISRKSIYYHLCRKNKNLSKGPVAQYYETIKSYYKAVSLCHEAWTDFDNAFLSGDSDRLTEFIEKYKETKFRSFVYGLNRDFKAIANAMKYQYTSAACEGGNNKFKEQKRACFGRAGDEYLEKKVIASFAITKEDKTAYDLLLKWFNEYISYNC